MSGNHPERTTVNSTGKQTSGLSIPRWVAVVGVLIVSLPFLMMSSMMLMMGWIDPAMGREMAGAPASFFRIAGFVPLLLVLAVLYSVSRL